jgi:hypothetical protein
MVSQSCLSTSLRQRSSSLRAAFHPPRLDRRAGVTAPPRLDRRTGVTAGGGELGTDSTGGSAEGDFGAGFGVALGAVFRAALRIALGAAFGIAFGIALGVLLAGIWFRRCWMLDDG